MQALGRIGRVAGVDAPLESYSGRPCVMQGKTVPFSTLCMDNIADATVSDIPYVKEVVHYVYQSASLLPVAVTRSWPVLLPHEKTCCGGRPLAARTLFCQGKLIAPDHADGGENRYHASSKRAQLNSKVDRHIRTARMVTDIYMPIDPSFSREASLALDVTTDVLSALHDVITTWCQCIPGARIYVQINLKDPVIQPGSTQPVKGFCQYKHRDTFGRPLRSEIYIAFTDHRNWFDFVHTLVHEVAHALAYDDPEGHGEIWLSRFSLLCCYLLHIPAFIRVLDQRDGYKGWRDRLVPILNVAPSGYIRTGVQRTAEVHKVEESFGKEELNPKALREETLKQKRAIVMSGDRPQAVAAKSRTDADHEAVNKNFLKGSRVHRSRTTRGHRTSTLYSKKHSLDAACHSSPYEMDIDEHLSVTDFRPEMEPLGSILELVEGLSLG